MSDNTKSTLYCFKVTEEDGKFSLCRYAINDYKTTSGAYKSEYHFLGKYIGENHRAYVSGDKMDRFVNNKVYSLNSSIADAERIIEQTLQSQCDAARAKLDRCTYRLDAWKAYADKGCISEGGD